MDDLPVRVGILETGFGVGAGCGIGIGVGAPLNLGAIPVLGPALSGLSAGLDAILGSVGQSSAGLRTGLRTALPAIKGLDGGLGCGVGLGYGFGVGLMVRPSAFDSMRHRAQELLESAQKRMPGPAPATTTPSTPSPSAVPAGDHPPSTSSTSEAALPMARQGVQGSLRAGVGLPPLETSGKDPSFSRGLGLEREAIRHAAGDEPLDVLLFRALLRQQEELRIVQRQNVQLQRSVEALAEALCDITRGKKAKERPGYCEELEQQAGGRKPSPRLQRPAGPSVADTRVAKPQSQSGTGQPPLDSL